MTARIEVLADGVVNRIAAGEVVERPFSVVKELVENALDAGARNVDVELVAGGKDSIRVTDDGGGIAADQLELALQRHATSKLRDADELTGIRTLGFRGEALPSIAAVSRFRVVTRPHDRDAAREILVVGGRLEHVRDAGAPPGTRVEAEELFFNTPARRAFLKADATELKHVTDWMQRLALARTAIGFRLEQGGRRYVDAPAAPDLETRIGSVLGRDVLRDLCAVDAMEGEAAITGFVSRPGRTRTNASGVYLVVNGRVVRDRGVVHAVSTGYGTMLAPGRYPIAVLVIEVPPEDVDVNVHPAKTEVRFRDGAAIHRLVRHAVRDTLREAPWAGSGAPPPEADARDMERGARGGPAPATTRDERPWRADLELRVGDGGAATRQTEAAVGSAPADVAGAPERIEARGYFGSLRAIGQLHRRYIVCESDDGLVLVDQHAAHERITYERLRAQLRDGGVASQELLLPETVEIGPLAERILAERAEALERLGFGVEAFGGSSVLVKRVPALLGSASVAEVVRDVLDGVDPHGAVEEVLGTMACHGSIRTGRELAAAEMRRLLEDLDRTDFRGNCPHGRNVFYELGAAEIERRVGR